MNPTQSTRDRHNITIDHYAEGACGTSGHYDTVVECSCGWSNRLSHGGGDTGILGHRLEVLERAAGIKTTISSKPYDQARHMQRLRDARR